MTGMFHVDGEFNLPPYCKRMICRRCQSAFQAVRTYQYICASCAEISAKMDNPPRAAEGVGLWT